MEPVGSEKGGAHLKKSFAGGNSRNVLDLKQQSSGSETKYSLPLNQASSPSEEVLVALPAGRAVPWYNIKIEGAGDTVVRDYNTETFETAFTNAPLTQASPPRPSRAAVPAVMKPSNLENRPVPDTLLHILARDYCKSWREIGTHLGIPEDSLKDIDMKYPFVEIQKSLKMFKEWKSRRGDKATVSVLEEALEKTKGSEMSEIVQAVMKPASLENRPVSDALLHILARDYCKSWREIGRHLGIPEDDLKDIDKKYMYTFGGLFGMQHPFDEEQKSLAMFQKWKSRRGDEATVSILQEALERTVRSDLSEKVQVPPQQEAPLPEVAAATAPEPSAALQHQAPPAEVSTAAPGPSELGICGPLTTFQEASDPDCTDDISRDPADSVHAPLATQHKMKNIVTATMRFEAEHEECVRVLPYIEGDQVVVKFYVFSGESGIPEHLKSAAKECFEEMKVKCKWLDLYNNADVILKVTPLHYPSGDPKRLNASQIDAISEIIGKNLRELDRHRNVTSVQASFKIKESKQTKDPCITIYVLGKGFIPLGESEFPHTLGPYPVDVVNGFWFRTNDLWTPNKAQEQSEVLCWGSSIGIEGEKESGTLGAIVEDGGNLYALSCNHVMKDQTEKAIIYPGLNDHLNYLKYHLNEYRNRIEGIVDRSGSDKSDIKNFSVDSLEEWNELSEKFIWLKSIKEKHVNSKRWTERKKDYIELHEGAFEKGLNRPREIGKYIAGVSRNVKWTDGKEYFIDLAIAKLTDDEVQRLRKSETAEMIGTTDDKPSGKCSPTTTEAIMNAKKLCKSGRTTEYTILGSVINASLDPPQFLKPPKFQTKRDFPLIDVLLPDYFCQIREKTQLTRRRESCSEDGALLNERFWCKNCLCIASGRTTDADLGDSGAVIFEQETMSGFGVLFGILENSYSKYVIASPLQVALAALSKEISEESNLRLVSNYVVPGRPTIIKPEDQVETSFTLTWKRPAYDGGDPNIKYKVEWRKKPVDCNPFLKEVDNIGETNLTVTDLEGGEDYEFKVFAKNKEGYSDPATRSYSVQRKDIPQAGPKFVNDIQRAGNIMIGDHIKASIGTSSADGCHKV